MKQKNQELTINDLISIENSNDETEEDEDLHCADCNAVVKSGQAKCENCGAELVWQ